MAQILASEAAQIPVLDFCKGGVGLEQEGSERWKEMSRKVRKACENHGCFLLMYGELIPMSLRDEMLMATKALFDLPEDIKQKHRSSKPYCSYSGNCSVIPLSQSFGINDTTNLNAAQAFTNLIETINSMSSKMLELNFIVLRMILESFGIEKYYDSQVANTANVFRLMKYKVPPNDDAAIGLVPHTDKNILTLLFQNDVQGLEVLTKEGNWVQVEIPEGSFVVMVGDALKAWSNGRLYAARHRVTMRGDKERYSAGLFLLPKEEMVIEVPQEFIDKDHPLLYRPFKYADYLTYFVSNVSDDALEIYAGV
ncbi:hypothetical protein FEM48_Zijuj06G0150500 [Ziziphus jujuba var. spinosa]|uniref:2-oxoglutarate-dependent dioxygenase DAO n=1 Tax=Ziziphus jujuba var. spinosa TaxID=714518 RepID=A0A978V9Z5_ZIZJJ|nr:hypothetical protein FEM48_Zijuj06G0150500 [Ziziphus jujuba var. spinosa]